MKNRKWIRFLALFMVFVLCLAIPASAEDNGDEYYEEEDGGDFLHGAPGPGADGAPVDPGRGAARRVGASACRMTPL